MKVLLTKDVKSLGKAGEIKDVKDGYGQNFLINRGFAKLATEAVISAWEEDRAEQEKRLQEELSRLETEKKTLEGQTIKIEKPLAPVGIQGSVGNADIASAIMDQCSIEIDKKSINLKKAIKSTGIHEVDIKLGHGLHAEAKIEIVGV